MRNSIERRAVWGLFLGLVGVISFSLTLPLTRIAVADMDAGTVAVWRGLIAALSAAAILLVFYRRWPTRAQLAPLFVTGIGIVIGFPLFTTLAMQTIPASHGAIVVGLLPISTAAVGILVTNERPPTAFWIASGIGTIAILIFVTRQSEGGIEIGHVYLLLAVLFAATGYAVGGKVAKEMGAARVICWALVLIAPALLVASFFVAPIPWHVPAKAILSFFYLALISQLAGFLAWYGGLAIGGVARVSQVQLLQIFLTLTASSVLLSEHINAEIWLFAGLVFCCVVASSRLRISTVSKHHDR